MWVKFSERLARENDWSLAYSQRVIEEYKRFIFLCCTSKEGITPSDAVDQAWHLHLTYTKSYWIDFCKNTLGKDIHHNPTQGGQLEAIKFEEYYNKTAQIYFEKFNIKAPADIWHDTSTRFKEINFKRINTDRFWLIKRPSSELRKAFAITILLITGLFFIQANVNSWIIIAVGIILIIIVNIAIWRKNGRNGGSGNGGCSGAGCSADTHHGSGCGSSGCSGCGGGD